MSPAGTGIVAQFPCRPDAGARRLLLAERSVELTLHVCTAQDQTFALASADVGDPARVAAALRGLDETLRANLGATVERTEPGQVPGMTPNARALRSVLVGTLPDGREVHAQALVFARGTSVYRATVTGAAVVPQAVQAFFGALRFPG
jgi:hypothetical protein